MIFNKEGQSFWYKGEQYIIGADIIATGASPYKGLGGKIKEIRTGKDKTTNNPYPDFCCTFDTLVLPSLRRKYEEVFSELYRKKVSLEEIDFDSVIMAPAMIGDERFKGAEVSIYLIAEEWANDGDYGTRFYTFPSKERALVKLNRMILNEQEDGLIEEWMYQDNYVSESDENSFECWLDGHHEPFHFSVRIHELSINLESSQIEYVARFHEESCNLEAFEMMIQSKCEKGEISKTQYEKLRKATNISNRISDKLGKNDTYMEQYWDTIEQVIKDELKSVKV